MAEQAVWSDAHLALDEPQDALRLADDAVAVFEAVTPVQRNLGSERMVRCQQVKAHLALGEYDGASEALGPVLETGLGHRVGPLVRRVSEIAMLADDFRVDANERRGIVEAATEFVRLSAPSPARSLE